jgi:hypothetical protein
MYRLSDRRRFWVIVTGVVAGGCGKADGAVKDVYLDEALLQEQLHRLSKGDGVLRDNLQGWLDPCVHYALRITQRGMRQSVTAAVSERLLELIGRLQAEDNRMIALHSFNLTGDSHIEPLKLVKRQEALENARGPSRSKSIKNMKKTIVPQLARMILDELIPPNC